MLKILEGSRGLKKMPILDPSSKKAVEARGSFMKSVGIRAITEDSTGGPFGIYAAFSHRN